MRDGWTVPSTTGHRLLARSAAGLGVKTVSRATYGSLTSLAPAADPELWKIWSIRSMLAPSVQPTILLDRWRPKVLSPGMFGAFAR